MRYLGGKSKIAKPLAEVINAARSPGGVVWEPFCGGLGATAELARGGPAFLSDACAPLIHMYRAYDAGWRPPEFVSKRDRELAATLPDTDPLKAFALFGCGFGGDAGGGSVELDWNGQPFAGQAARSLARTWEALRACGEYAFACEDFAEGPVRARRGWAPLVIYCDPPYANTEPFALVPTFDRAAFVRRCEEWAALGAIVLVSELTPPAAWECVWSHERARHVPGRGTVTEKLFLVNA